MPSGFNTDALRPVLPTAKPAIFLQDACFQHRYIRSRDTSTIFERPERLRAVTVGLAAAMSRLEGVAPPDNLKTLDPDDLASQLGRLNIESNTTTNDPLKRASQPVSIVQSTASADLLRHPAVKYVHGDIDGDVYLENLARWTKECRYKIEKGESEIPEHLSQGDLYLCPESLVAIQGAIGTVCEAVDAVAGSAQPVFVNQLPETPVRPVNRAFVAVRPPGHHCGEDTPSGFCFVNNVAIGAAHAHLIHGINRIVILDIDLHHGNGTQSIVWQMNEETYRQTLETEGGAPASKKGPQVYYGSIHDILSYPCEDGKAELVQAASVSIAGSHGQYIENVHLQTYTSPEHWEKLYTEQYSKILRKAENFLDSTGGPGSDVLVFISCGMDASEHETPSMSRHNRRVPTSFYHRFARDACALAEQYAGGKVISVLEGGYSDRALTSGSMAHLAGLVDAPVDEEWWSTENLVLLEKATKKRRGGRPSLTPANVHPWLERAVALFTSLDGSLAHSSASAPRAPLPPSSMTLRDRKKPNSAATSAASSPRGKAVAAAGEAEASSSDSSSSDDSPPPSASAAEKKLPRVILRLGPAPAS
ncbi:histone deacetylase domain-containing protein [Mycena rosella]|uniref:Histone deacetylase domain-containing protein n=1 Tax=Mycena rosella TaxID=1033263 RepID=A0AAD7GTE8_MYCRO|nr:histone deacetylase domain-containing protein [Mycena rosella]